jgi:cell division protein FtsB
MRKRLFDVFVLAFCLLLHGYFGWHYLYGSRNAAALAAMKGQAEALSAELAGEIATRQALEGKVALLRPQGLDLDMLDETARRILAYYGSEELVVPINPSKNNNLN